MISLPHQPESVGRMTHQCAGHCYRSVTTKVPGHECVERGAVSAATTGPGIAMAFLDMGRALVFSLVRITENEQQKRFSYELSHIRREPLRSDDVLGGNGDVWWQDDALSIALDDRLHKSMRQKPVCHLSFFLSFFDPEPMCPMSYRRRALIGRTQVLELGLILASSYAFYTGPPLFRVF